MTTRAVQDIEEDLDTCITQVVPTEFKWIIPNFSLEDFIQIESKDYYSNDQAGNNYKWVMTLLNKGDIIDFLIWLMEPRKYKPTSVYVSILDKYGKKYKTLTHNNYDNENLTYNGKGDPTKNYPIDVGFRRHDIINFMKSDVSSGNCLIILCEVYIDDNVVHTNQLDFKLSIKRYEKMSSDFAKLFQNSKFSDVTIKLNDGREFKAHKAVLAARSDYFAAMFEHNMMENIENCVTITDVDSAVFEEMLRFIYSGKLLKFNEMFEQLLIVADKYQVADLKLECEQKLFNELTKTNVFNTLYLAHRYNLDCLKKYTIEFLKKNLKDYEESIEFANFSKLHPELLEEMTMAASESP